MLSFDVLLHCVSNHASVLNFCVTFYGQTAGKSSKKRKLTSHEASPSASHNRVEEGSAFVPFNYSAADYSTFSGKRLLSPLFQLTVLIVRAYT